jgi:hypothetical protein
MCPASQLFSMVLVYLLAQVLTQRWVSQGHALRELRVHGGHGRSWCAVGKDRRRR